MTVLKVQCKGSGKPAGFIPLDKGQRAACPICSRICDLTSAGKIRRHDRIVTKRQLRRMG